MWHHELGDKGRLSSPGISSVLPAAGKNSTKYWQRYADCSALVVGHAFVMCAPHTVCFLLQEELSNALILVYANKQVC